MKKMILYTTHCPKCNILNKKLQDKNVEYEIVEDINVISSLGIKSVPVLCVSDDENTNMMTYFDAVKYINSL